LNIQKTPQAMASPERGQRRADPRAARGFDLGEDHPEPAEGGDERGDGRGTEGGQARHACVFEAGLGVPSCTHFSVAISAVAKQMSEGRARQGE